MSKTLFFSLIFFGFVFCGNAQKSKVEYGFLAGVNANTIYGDSFGKDIKGNTAGLSAGAFIQVNTSENFGLKTGLSYEQFGWAFRNLVFGNNLFPATKSDVVFKLNYLHLPLVAVYTFGSKVRFNVEGGPFVGFLLNNNTITTIKGPVPTGQQQKTERSSDSYKSTNFGVQVGAGMQIPIASKINLVIGLRNVAGLSGIYKSIGSTDDNAAKTLSFSALSGVRFAL